MTDQARWPGAALVAVAVAAAWPLLAPPAHAEAPREARDPAGVVLFPVPVWDGHPEARTARRAALEAEARRTGGASADALGELARIAASDAFAAYYDAVADVAPDATPQPVPDFRAALTATRRWLAALTPGTGPARSEARAEAFAMLAGLLEEPGPGSDLAAARIADASVLALGVSGRTTATSALRLADHRFEDGDLAGARPLYERALDAEPAGPAAGYAHYKLGWVAYNLGDPAEAVRAFRAARDRAREDRHGASLVREADRDRARAWAALPDPAWEAAVADLRSGEGLDAAASDPLVLAYAEALADAGHLAAARLVAARLAAEVTSPAVTDRLGELRARLEASP